MERRNKLKSTTLWIAIGNIIVFLTACIIDHKFKMSLLNSAIEKGIKLNDINQISGFITNIPLTTIAGAVVATSSLFGFKRAGQNIAGQLKPNNNSDESNISNK